MKYTDAFSTRQTPQSEPIPGKDMVKGKAGGFVFALDDWKRLDRFLILGADAPTYYSSAKELTVENANCVLRCLKVDGKRTVDRIVEISVEGRAPKNDPALFALALCASPEFSSVAQYALDHLPEVARTGTHLFQFADYIQHFRGWGRSLREAVASWYLSKDISALAYQVVKYQQREGWSHRDLLRLSHPQPTGPGYQDIFHWVVKGELPESPSRAFFDSSIVGFELARRAKTEEHVVKLIRDYRLTREMVPTEWLREPDVWEALLETMPMMAMIRNLATMTRVGLLRPMSSATSKVVSCLESDGVRKARVHPLQVLVALETYRGGHGVARAQAIGYHGRGRVSTSDVPTWKPVSQVVDALDAAFYHSFGNVESTGKRWMLALDVSGSMTGPELSGMPGITPRVGSAAMALITAKTEPNHLFTAFTSARGSWGAAISPLDISPRMRLDDVIRKVSGLPFGGTDCSLPMIYANEQKLEVDVFVVYTDSETWAGSVHPVQVLQQYRQRTGIPAKLVVVGMTSNGFTIADPSDGGMLDCVGFDTASPQLISDFARW